MKYRLLDSGNKTKLEMLGNIRVIRPALNAFWPATLPEEEWHRAAGVLERDTSGDGHWKWRVAPPEKWTLEWAGFNLLVKPTSFGHIGFFPEQYQNWEWQRRAVKTIKGNTKVLNLFGYSGVGSMAMADAGAEVCHLDASRGMIDWGKSNLTLNPQIPARIRWIVDDAGKFIAREERRGNKYNGLVMDPPSFGRGPQGQIWKIEDDMLAFLRNCARLLDFNNPFFVVFSCHTPGFSPLTMTRMLQTVFGDGKVESGEMTIPEESGKSLPAGNFARFMKS